MTKTYNPPLRTSTLRIAKYGVPGDVLDLYVADRVRDMVKDLLSQRCKVSYASVYRWADELSDTWENL